MPPLSRAAREGLEQALEQSPRIEWDELRPRLERAWKPGEHISIFGPNGYGKTTVGVELGEISPQPTIMFVTKKRDRLVRELPKQGWTLARTLDQVQTQLEPSHSDRYFGRRDDAMPPRIVFWPTATGGLKQRRAKLRTIAERLLDFVYEHGRITLIVDEGLFLIRNLRQGENAEMIWHEARSSSVSLVVLSQRPSWLPHSAYSAPTYLVMFTTNDKDDLKRLSDIGGAVDPEPLRRELRVLPMYEFLLVAPRSRPAWSVRTKVAR